MVYSESTVKKLEQVLLGHNVKDVDVVILVPLRSVYSLICHFLAEDILEYKGFYNNAIINIAGKSVLVINIPQGIQAQDILTILSRKKILFFGYGGSLYKQYDVGKVFEVTIGVLPNGEKFYLNSTKAFPPVTGGYSPCMLGELAEYYCEISRNSQCHVVDMEIAYCASAAAQNKNIFTAWVMITDIPGEQNFWEISDNLQNEIKIGIDRVMNAIKEFIIEQG